MGLDQFLSVDWSLCLFCLRSSTIYTSSTVWNQPHLCVPVWKSTRLRGWCIIISLPVPWVCLLCQHARSVPAWQRVIPEVSALPWTFPEVLDVLRAKMWCHCARWLKTHKTELMVQFYLKWWYLYSFITYVMAFWLCMLSFKC